MKSQYEEWKEYNIDKLRADFCKVYLDQFEQFALTKFSERKAL